MCLYYYRDKDQKEIDLIYVEGDVLFPIKIKKGISPNAPDKHFEVMKKYSNNVSTGIILCMTKKLQPIIKIAGCFQLNTYNNERKTISFDN